MAELKVNDLAYHAWIRDLKAYYRQLQIGVVNLPQVVEDLKICLDRMVDVNGKWYNYRYETAQ